MATALLACELCLGRSDLGGAAFVAMVAAAVVIGVASKISGRPKGPRPP
jgi:hypothetical protein